MKKIIALLLAICLAAGMTACGESKETGNNSGSSGALDSETKVSESETFVKEYIDCIDYMQFAEDGTFVIYTESESGNTVESGTYKIDDNGYYIFSFEGTELARQIDDALYNSYKFKYDKSTQTLKTDDNSMIYEKTDYTIPTGFMDKVNCAGTYVADVEGNEMTLYLSDAKQAFDFGMYANNLGIDYDSIFKPIFGDAVGCSMGTYSKINPGLSFVVTEYNTGLTFVDSNCLYNAEDNSFYMVIDHVNVLFTKTSDNCPTIATFDEICEALTNYVESAATESSDAGDSSFSSESSSSGSYSTAGEKLFRESDLDYYHECEMVDSGNDENGEYEYYAVMYGEGPDMSCGYYVYPAIGKIIFVNEEQNIRRVEMENFELTGPRNTQ